VALWRCRVRASRRRRSSPGAKPVTSNGKHHARRWRAAGDLAGRGQLPLLEHRDGERHAVQAVLKRSQATRRHHKLVVSDGRRGGHRCCRLRGCDGQGGDDSVAEYAQRLAALPRLSARLQDGARAVADASGRVSLAEPFAGIEPADGAGPSADESQREHCELLQPQQAYRVVAGRAAGGGCRPPAPDGTARRFGKQF